MPTDGAPSDYLGGVIYTQLAHCKWRVYVQKGMKNDHKISWGGDKLAAWHYACSKIEHFAAGVEISKE